VNELEPSRASRGAEPVRPGSMTRAMRAMPQPSSVPRWLRWAVVRDGRIVSEAVISPDRVLTAGMLGDVPCAAIVKAEPLAVCANGEWRVLLSRGWTAQANGRTTTEGEIELETTAKVSIEGASVLLQLVERPPVRATPQLPAAVQTGWFGRADWWFTSFVTASLMIHFGIVVFVLEADFPIESASSVPERHAGLIFMEPPEPDEETVQEIADSTEESTEPSEEATSTETPSEEHATNTRPSPRPRPRPDAPSDPSISDPDLSQEFASLQQLMLGAQTNDNGAVTDLLENGAATENAGQLIADANGVEVVRDPNAIASRNNGCPSCVNDHGIEGLRRDVVGPREVEEGPEIVEVTVRPPPIDELEPIDPPPTDFDARELVRAIRMRMRAIQACYEREMTQGNPDLRGRLTMEMQVMPVGTVSGVRAAENTTGSEALAACTVRNLATIRVRTGPSEPVRVSYPIVFERQ
jgi:hypothetical protein